MGKSTDKGGPEQNGVVDVLGRRPPAAAEARLRVPIESLPDRRPKPRAPRIPQSTPLHHNHSSTNPTDTKHTHRGLAWLGAADPLSMSRGPETRRSSRPDTLPSTSAHLRPLRRALLVLLLLATAAAGAGAGDTAGQQQATHDAPHSRTASVLHFLE